MNGVVITINVYMLSIKMIKITCKYHFVLTTKFHTS